jgi:hypothetical protein
MYREREREGRIKLSTRANMISHRTRSARTLEDALVSIFSRCPRPTLLRRDGDYGIGTLQDSSDEPLSEADRLELKAAMRRFVRERAGELVDIRR